MDYEKLFYKALYTVIEHNGGSLEESLDDIGITNSKERRTIKKMLDWDNE